MPPRASRRVPRKWPPGRREARAMLRLNRKTTILLVAGVVVCGLTAGLVLGGGSIGGSLGVIGRGVLENTVGLFAYTNKSTDAGKTFPAGRPSAARRRAAPQTTAGTAADAAVAGVATPGSPDAATASVSGSTTDTVLVTPMKGVPATGADAGTTSDVPGDGSTNASSEDPLQGYTEATVAPPLEENDVTIDPDSEESSGGKDDFAFDDEQALRSEGPSYSGLGKKDPFYAMVTAKEQKAASSELLDPDRVRLVGVIWGRRGIGALVE